MESHYGSKIPKGPDRERSNMETILLEIYIPALLLGVCVILDPAPIPACLGVPGTMILELVPLDTLVARASSTAFFADLHKISTPRQ